jgi:protein-arginine kinase activator protein McsA
MKTIDQQIQDKLEALYKAISRDQFELAVQLRRDLYTLEDKKKTEEVRVYAL